jgi:hypothetical protein
MLLLRFHRMKVYAVNEQGANPQTAEKRTGGEQATPGGWGFLASGRGVNSRPRQRVKGTAENYRA